MALALFLAAVDGDPVVIRVDTVEVKASTIRAQAAELRATGKPFSPDQLVEGFVTESLLVAEARKLGLHRDPDVEAMVAYTRQKLLAGKFVEEELGKSVRVPEEEIRRLYHLGNDNIRLGLVVVATPEEAAAVRKRLEAGGELALEAAHSLDPATASRRGDTGRRSRLQIDTALADAAFAAPVGSLVGPVKYGPGWAVARVEERVLAPDAELPKVRSQIVASARKRAIASARTHLVEMLRGAKKATVDEALLKRLLADNGAGKSDQVVASVGERRIRLREVLPAIRSVANVGHGGTAAGVAAAQQFVDELLLAAEASKRGLDTTPEAVTSLDAVARNVVSRFMAEKASSAAGADATQAKRARAFEDRVKKLRKAFKIQVDRMAALQAASVGP